MMRHRFKVELTTGSKIEGDWERITPDDFQKKVASIQASLATGGPGVLVVSSFGGLVINLIPHTAIANLGIEKRND